MSEQHEIRNAIIEGATISNADHGLLTVWVRLDYGDGGHQGFGGWSLYTPKNLASPNYAGHFIWRVLQVAGVSEWSKVAGRTVRVRSSHSHVSAIGHIVREDWFDPAADFKAMEK